MFALFWTFFPASKPDTQYSSIQFDWHIYKQFTVNKQMEKKEKKKRKTIHLQVFWVMSQTQDARIRKDTSTFQFSVNQGQVL